MSDPSDRTFTADFRRFFLRGLVVLLPTVLTLWIVVMAYLFVQNRIADPINAWIRYGMINSARVWEPLREEFDPTPQTLDNELATLRAAGQAAGTAEPDPGVVRARLRNAAIQDWWAAHWYMDLIGVAVAIIAVYIAGRLLGGFFGRRIYRKIEDLITTLPVFKQVYPYIKQIVDFLFSDDQALNFNRVVACEYPRKGIWSVGFQTGPTLSTINAIAGESVTIFIPSSPTPFTGYTITVPRQDVIELPITVEEAIRFAVSGGVLVPGHQQEGGELSPEASASLPSGLIPIPGVDPNAAADPAEPGESEGDDGEDPSAHRQSAPDNVG